jgi:ubiquitin-protein ligase
MSKKALKRILTKDMKEIENKKLEDLGIYIQFNEENILEANAMIVGPKDSLYAGGILFFKIKFPHNYPFSPPDVVYISRNKIRIHPNIYVSSGTNGLGKICLSILGTWSGPKWTSIMDISTILLSIQSLLDTNPLSHEPGSISKKKDINNAYNDVIQYETIKTLLLVNCKNIPLGYESFIPHMIDNVERFKEIHQGIILKHKGIKRNYIIPFYRIHMDVDYPWLHSTYTAFIKNYKNYLKI